MATTLPACMKDSHGSERRVRPAIINYGMGNLVSVRNGLRFLGYEPTIVAEPDALNGADAYVLPGVGAFGEAMTNLESHGLAAALTREVMEKGKPFFGICLGMQLLAKRSAELGSHRGLGWIDGEVLPLPDSDAVRVPHVGWSELSLSVEEPLFRRIESTNCFFFDHSFHLSCAPQHVIASCHHGMDIIAAVRANNLFAVQFHPEKSQRPGLKLLRNFLDLCEAQLSRQEEAPAPNV